MERKKCIAPSLLAANFTNLDSELNKLKDANIKYLHYDVMDGHFVPNISFGPAILKQIKKYGFHVSWGDFCIFVQISLKESRIRMFPAVQSGDLA